MKNNNQPVKHIAKVIGSIRNPLGIVGVFAICIAILIYFLGSPLDGWLKAICVLWLFVMLSGLIWGAYHITINYHTHWYEDLEEKIMGIEQMKKFSILMDSKIFFLII
ncbi:MAG: hypothetical protein P9X24_04485 [Candidatus Hatepunaea meridiana]|nr:hypothetical protein [Candidatus Hatepunaea meridiana]